MGPSAILCPLIHPMANVYGQVGEGTKVAAFAEIGGVVGERCKVQAFAFIPPGVTIGHEVFIGPHVVFTNDSRPRATGHWHLERTTVADGASIGAGAIILPGVMIGLHAEVGAGSVVDRNVPPGWLWVGDRRQATLHPRDV